ncbi:Transcriptional regulator CtsR [bioreactor metagenome]|uniref:Transcriptional regulator CtsR n=1 Tax=bioreactor metagenome TaxID=1076179 RepID=A0A645IDY3_9ZZZZ|nr:CtsR family transcriptional regulator [Syntrophomonadaceae bacterium]
MKKSLASGIEQYIKVLIARSESGQIEIQRVELAETFACVPSQVSYVLSTRFSQEDGYIVETRRGGQGYIRITEVRKETGNLDDKLLRFLNEVQAKKLLKPRETEMLKSIMLNVGAGLPAEYKSRVYQGFAAALRKYLNKGG